MKRFYLSTTDITNQRRVTLPPAAMRNLGLKTGDSLEINIDTETREIVMSKVEAAKKPRKR